MKSKDAEYRELFLVEAKDNIEQLNTLFVDLEKDHASEEVINAIFRITHTLKGNAMGMGFDAVADLAHVMEDVMIAIRDHQVKLGQKLFEMLFRANDKLGQLVAALETGEKVSYLGIKTTLSIYLKNQLEKGGETPAEEASQPEQKTGGQDAGSRITFSDVIQIPVKKMDDLLNQVGMLAIERDRLFAVSRELGIKSSEFDRLQRITSNLQYSIMDARMVQVAFLFNKFHRVLRDAAAIEDKKVNLVLKGTETEIDRNILKIISDSLVHLIRNAVSHGIEPEAMRKERKKEREGTVTLGAQYERDRVVISVSDDGGGIDHEMIRKKLVEKGLVSDAMAAALGEREVIRYIFESGFSNYDQVNELSGRGVGMDVVKKAVESIGGQVHIETQVGEGTTISLHVPSSLALKGTLLFEVNHQEYAIALSYTEAVISITKKDIHKLSGGLMTRYQEEAITLVFLQDILQARNLSDLNGRGALQKAFLALDEPEARDVIIVSYAGRTTGLVVDRVLQQKEIIEKPLASPVDKIRMLSGTTILGSGKVCPVIDVAVLTDLIHKHHVQAQLEA